jgi:predicted ferric reductase
VLQLWFVSRALGLVALLLLTLVIVLGILHDTSVVKNADLGLPRFVLVALHRNLSLITVVFVVLHVVTVVVTPYLRLRWIDTLVPGIAAYNPIAAAMGTVAVDLLVAITVTSLFRQRIPRRAWFLVHWTAYVCWPVTVLHAVLNASFRGTTWWTLVAPLLCLGALVAALLYRRSDRRRTAVPLGERGQVPPEALRPLRVVRPPGGDPGGAD